MFARFARAAALLCLGTVFACGQAAPGGVDDDGDDATGPDGKSAPLPASTGHASRQATVGGQLVWAHFTDPPSHAGSDPTIVDELIRLIDGTPRNSGAWIRVALYSLTLQPVADALVRAAGEGVDVQVVHDSRILFDKHPEVATTLETALGPEHFVFCGDREHLDAGHGCITSDPSGRMHTKLALFSETTDPDGHLHPHVSWFGSANMTGSTGEESFNNTITVYEDAELHASLAGYFNQMFHQSKFEDYFSKSAGRGYIPTETVTVWISPEQQYDLVDEQLKRIEGGSGCRIRVAQEQIRTKRKKLVLRLAELAAAKCDIEVVTHRIDAEALGILEDARIPVRLARVHDKTILVRARFDGSKKRRDLVFTGSHNWSYPANNENDEMLVKLESTALYSAYRLHFEDAYDGGKAAY